MKWIKRLFRKDSIYIAITWDKEIKVYLQGKQVETKKVLDSNKPWTFSFWIN